MDNTSLIQKTLSQVMPKFPNIASQTIEKQNSYLHKITFLVLDMNPSINVKDSKAFFSLRKKICEMLGINIKSLIIYPTIAVAAMITNKQNTHFLACQLYGNPSIPKGGVEENETFAEAITREVFEETNLIIDFTGSQYYPLDLGDQILIVFKAQVHHLKVDTLKPLSRDEIHGYKLISLKCLGDGILSKKLQPFENQLKYTAMTNSQSNDEIIQEMLNTTSD